jgi:hypothetical protein
MPIGHIAHSYFPYCLQKQADGSYLILNRDYKPVGFNTKEHLVYENYPVAVQFARLLPATAAKLSVHGKPDLDAIYLYNDGTVPTDSQANMAAYLARLELLAKLKVKSK